MDGGRFGKILFLLCVFLVEMVLGAPKCTGRWAIHSCGGGNGKRSEIDFGGDDEGRSQDEGFLPGFELPEPKVIDGRTRVDDGYDSRGDEEDLSSYRGTAIDGGREEAEFDDRRERLLQVLIRRLLREKLASDYDD